MPNIITDIVISGGGARGVGLPAVYLALRDAQMWDAVKTIAGSSVGSLSAAFFSVSPSMTEVKNIFLDKNILEIMKIDQIKIQINMSLQPLEQFLNQYLLNIIRDYLASQQNALMDEKNVLEQVVNVAEPEDDISQKILMCDILLNMYQRFQAPDAQVTFQDMYWLNKRYPGKFKNIIVTSVSTRENGMGQFNLYDYRKTPTQPIATACAASSALPIVFSPVTIDGVVHRDGGCEDPIPSEYFEDNSLEKQAQRLLFAFGDGPSFVGPVWKNAIHGRPNPPIFFRQNNPKEQAGALENPVVNQPNIYVWVDNNLRQISYLIQEHGYSDIENKISFDELQIPVTQLTVDEDSFKMLHSRFYTELSTRGHISSILGKHSPLWWFQHIKSAIRSVVGLQLDPAYIIEYTCQRFKAFYPFNTVLLKTTISGTDFDKSERLKHVIFALYYLDTMNHVTLYQLSPNERHQQFYLAILKNYLKFYKTYLKATGLEQDDWLNQYEAEKASPRYLFERIHEEVGRDHDSPRALALMLAVEHHLGYKEEQEILDKINQAACVDLSGIKKFWCKRVFVKQHEFTEAFSIHEGHSPKI